MFHIGSRTELSLIELHSWFRKCPGRYFAQTVLFTLISSVLHTYWISAPTDENGNPMPVNIKMTLGVISYVFVSQCRYPPSRLIGTQIR